MAEAIGVTDTVTVEVVRASPFGGAPAVGGGGAATAALPPEYIFIAIGAVVAIAFVFFGVRRYMGVSKQTYRTVTPVQRRSLPRSVGIAALFGFVGFLLSASPLSWILATGIFYHQYVMKME